MLFDALIRQRFLTKCALDIIKYSHNLPLSLLCCAFVLAYLLYFLFGLFLQQKVFKSRRCDVKYMYFMQNILLTGLACHQEVSDTFLKLSFSPFTFRTVCVCRSNFYIYMIHPRMECVRYFHLCCVIAQIQCKTVATSSPSTELKSFVFNFFFFLILRVQPSCIQFMQTMRNMYVRYNIFNFLLYIKLLTLLVYTSSYVHVQHTQYFLGYNVKHNKSIQVSCLCVSCA